jgi:hypothetical protein
MRDRISGSVALPDLRQAIADRHWPPVRASRHVAVYEGLGQEARRWPEVSDQFTGETSFLGLGQRTGVMRDHPAQQRLGVFGVTEVPRTV